MKFYLDLVSGHKEKMLQDFLTGFSHETFRHTAPLLTILVPVLGDFFNTSLKYYEPF